MIEAESNQDLDSKTFAEFLERYRTLLYTLYPTDEDEVRYGLKGGLDAVPESSTPSSEAD